MKIEVRLGISFPTEEGAQVVHDAIEPDSRGFLRIRREANRLLIEADADRPGTLLNTLDDLLASQALAAAIGRRLVPK